MVQIIGKIQRVIKVGKICDKDEILTVEEKWIALIGKMKKSPWNDCMEKRVWGKTFEVVHDKD